MANLISTRNSADEMGAGVLAIVKLAARKVLPYFDAWPKALRISPDTHTRSAGGALRQQKFTYFLKKISSPNKEKEGSDHCQRPACVQSEPHSRLTNGDEQRR